MIFFLFLKKKEGGSKTTEQLLDKVSYYVLARMLSPNDGVEFREV